MQSHRASSRARDRGRSFAESSDTMSPHPSTIASSSQSPHPRASNHYITPPSPQPPSSSPRPTTIHPTQARASKRHSGITDTTKFYQNRDIPAYPQDPQSLRKAAENITEPYSHKRSNSNLPMFGKSRDEALAHLFQNQLPPGYGFGDIESSADHYDWMALSTNHQSAASAASAQSFQQYESSSDYMSPSWGSPEPSEGSRNVSNEFEQYIGRPLENPFISSTKKSRSDTDSQVFSARQHHSMATDEHQGDFSSSRSKYEDARSMLSPFDSNFGRSEENIQRGYMSDLETPTFSPERHHRSRKSKTPEPVRTPKSTNGPVLPRPRSATKPFPTAEYGRPKNETELALEQAERDSPLDDTAAVNARKQAAIKAIQDLFKAQVAKAFEESQRVIEPKKAAVTNDAYKKLDSFKLLTHPVLRLGLLHNKCDERSMRQRFRDLIQAIPYEEHFNISTHVETSGRLLRDLQNIAWNIKTGQEPTPVSQVQWVVPGYHPITYGAGPQRPQYGSKSSNEENSDPVKGSRETFDDFEGLASPDRRSHSPIPLGDASVRAYAQSFINRDAFFRASPLHWEPPADYKEFFPSAARWEEITLIKTYHQALTVQQHLYMMFVTHGTLFMTDWMRFLMPRERCALIIRAFSLTLRMSADDGHQWIDKEWAEMDPAAKQEQMKSEPPPPPPSSKKPRPKLAELRQKDVDGLPMRLHKDMYSGIIVNINPKRAPMYDMERSLASYATFCHEIDQVTLSREPELISRLFGCCLIQPNLADFPIEPETQHNYFYKPAMSITEPKRVPLGATLRDNVIYLNGIPLGSNTEERVRADRTFFYSTFCFNLICIWRDYRDEKIWWYGNGTPHRYDPNKPPAKLGQPRSKFPRTEKWTEPSEIQQHIEELQRLMDVTNMGIYLERWVPEDDMPREPEEEEAESIFHRQQRGGPPRARR